ncbi:uncharacterized protein LOC118926887 [Manis pentadactyla]|uniref:uncharacterized protein LOC118926887 n=1 Tax=Manis pentadactyla TaxID=143292 RepID=UPI00255C950F|nr:uncharacterized protein LOC118926887 [Manis pentadactyla]
MSKKMTYDGISRALKPAVLIQWFDAGRQAIHLLMPAKGPSRAEVLPDAAAQGPAHWPSRHYHAARASAAAAASQRLARAPVVRADTPPDASRSRPSPTFRSASLDAVRLPYWARSRRSAGLLPCPRLSGARSCRRCARSRTHLSSPSPQGVAGPRSRETTPRPGLGWPPAAGGARGLRFPGWSAAASPGLGERAPGGLPSTSPPPSDLQSRGQCLVPVFICLPEITPVKAWFLPLKVQIPGGSLMISVKSPTQGKGQVLEVHVDHIMNSEMK